MSRGNPSPDLKPDLLAYLGGIVRELQGKAIAANSLPDHVHMLLWLPPVVAAADALRVLKTNSSRWVHERVAHLRESAGFRLL